jgi:hypothetical protein
LLLASIPVCLFLNIDQKVLGLRVGIIIQKMAVSLACFTFCCIYSKIKVINNVDLDEIGGTEHEAASGCGAG